MNCDNNNNTGVLDVGATRTHLVKIIKKNGFLRLLNHDTQVNNKFPRKTSKKDNQGALRAIYNVFLSKMPGVNILTELQKRRRLGAVVR